MSVNPTIKEKKISEIYGKFDRTMKEKIYKKYLLHSKISPTDSKTTRPMSISEKKRLHNIEKQKAPNFDEDLKTFIDNIIKNNNLSSTNIKPTIYEFYNYIILLIECQELYYKFCDENKQELYYIILQEARNNKIEGINKTFVIPDYNYDKATVTNNKPVNNSTNSLKYELTGGYGSENNTKLKIFPTEDFDIYRILNIVKNSLTKKEFNIAILFLELYYNKLNVFNDKKNGKELPMLFTTDDPAFKGKDTKTLTTAFKSLFRKKPSDNVIESKNRVKHVVLKSSEDGTPTEGILINKNNKFYIINQNTFEEIEIVNLTNIIFFEPNCESLRKRTPSAPSAQLPTNQESSASSGNSSVPQKRSSASANQSKPSENSPSAGDPTVNRVSNNSTPPTPPTKSFNQLKEHFNTNKPNIFEGITDLKDHILIKDVYHILKAANQLGGKESNSHITKLCSSKDTISIDGTIFNELSSCDKLNNGPGLENFSKKFCEHYSKNKDGITDKINKFLTNLHKSYCTPPIYTKGGKRSKRKTRKLKTRKPKTRRRF